MILAHKHQVYDTDEHFKIDRITRNILDKTVVKSVLIQGDHNSERYTFEIPRYIDGHDMSLCDLVEIHYLNTDSTTREENRGVYIVDDLQPSPEDEENVVIFSWLISSNVTKYPGPLSFLIRLACTDDGNITYAWNTGINKDKSIQVAMFNSETIAEQYPDVIAQILNSVENKLNKTGYNPNKYLGTDDSGAIVEKEAPTGGGTSDYNNLNNKPQIAGITLTGNKTLERLGIQPKGEYALKNEIPKTLPASDVSNWAKQPTKPVYTANEIKAEPAGSIDIHNTSNTAHSDIRNLITSLTNKLNALADSDDTTLDQLSEIVAYIKNNKTLIDSVTTSKIDVSDIVNNLSTNDAKKVLSAQQGVFLRQLNEINTRNILQKVSLPTSTEGAVINGDAGQFAVSDGKGGITWSTITNGNEVSY